MTIRARIPSVRRHGVALVLVLSLLVLLSAMVVAFFSSTSNTQRETSLYEAGVAARQLADVATNVVIAQITDGTRGWEVPSGNSADKGGGARLAYSTQPGLIRTYDDKGNPGRAFKLYSSDTMVTGAGVPWNVAGNLDTEVPADWPAQPVLYTDINRPVIVEDPNGKIATGGAGRKFTAIYPVLDPLALVAAGSVAGVGVDGFDLADVPGYKQTGRPVVSESEDPTAVVGRGKTANPAAMPVQWIYVLQDGTLTSPTKVSGDGLTASWATLPNSSRGKPGKANPIIGRIAFWTDDETCKLNVNTASEPTPWDTPRAISIQDLRHGLYQPARQEFQRYPGHPFMTALSPVLYPKTPLASLTTAQRRAISDLVPRVEFGGSQAGTVGVGDPNFSAVNPDADRLFASADELVFAPRYMPDPKDATRQVRGENALKDTAGASVALNAARLRRARFFLTANSRAPEVNLFGHPRISLWPQHFNAAQRTAFDRLSAFCSTLGSGANARPYYFQRSDPRSPVNDWTNIARNRELYGYLQTLTAADIPGIGGNFLAKWGDGRDQILTEIFDYIRCVNLRDNSPGATQFTSNGQVAPIKIGDTKGFGRFHTISQFGIHFICSQDGPDGASDASNPPLAKGTKAIEAALLFEPFSPSLGYHELRESISYEVTWLGPMSVDGVDLQFPTGTVKLAAGGTFGNIWHGRYWGGAQGIRGPVNSFGGGSYPLVSKRTKLGGSGNRKTMSFSGGQIQVKVYSGTTPSPANLVQTFTVSFPNASSMPVPDLVTTGTAAYRGTGSTTPDYWWTFSKRYSGTAACPHAPGAEYAAIERRWADSGGPPGFKTGGIFRAEDVVRTIVPEHGDIRLIAAHADVGPTRFVEGGSYRDQTRNFDHLFSEPQGPHLLYGFANEPGLTSQSGSQLTDASYHYSRLPEITPGAGKKFNKWNDFDNGFAHLTDGAYINKPDEGNITQKGGYAYFSWNFTAPSAVLFSPNRLIPSAGMLGSLPTGVKRDQPWQTLLFRPEDKHPGEGTPKIGPPFSIPPDHLIMDLFWTPVVQPYAISELFSTAGKVNMNYEIAPFSYIRRTTALHGVMKAEEPLLVPNQASKIYKLWDHETNDHPWLPNDARNKDAQVRSDWDKAFKGQAPFDKMRRPIDVGKTLAQFDARFADGRAFRSATEICDIHLVRDGEALSDYQDGKVWPNNLVTGENTRERPYTNLYGRLTTKSNTFTVHMCVQTLRKRPGANVVHSAWREDLDSVTGEYRGATLIERYVELGGSEVQDFATNPDAVLDNFYKFRIVSSKKFNP